MLALCIAALLLYVPANFFPVLEIHFLGSVRDTTVIQGAIAVIEQGYPIVGLAVLLAAVIAPGILILSIFFQILIVRYGLGYRKLKSLYKQLLKYHGTLTQLTMLEIYVISFLVSAFQLSDFSDIFFGMGSFCFTLLFAVVLFLQREYNKEHMWSFLNE